MSPAKLFWVVSAIALGSVTLLGVFWPWAFWLHIILGPLFLIGICDFFQHRQNIRRNFPLVGNLRYLFESIRPEIQQYFVESDISGRPFTREFLCLA